MFKVFARKISSGLQLLRITILSAAHSVEVSAGIAILKYRIDQRRQNTGLRAAALISGLVLLVSAFCAILGGLIGFLSGALLGLLALEYLYKIAPRFFGSFDPRVIRASSRKFPDIEQIVHDLSAAANIATPHLLIWDSEHIFAGCIPSKWHQHFLLLTTPLIDNLTASELRAVIAHEVSHIEEQDARWRRILLGVTTLAWRTAKPVGLLLAPVGPAIHSMRQRLDRLVVEVRCFRSSRPVHEKLRANPPVKTDSNAAYWIRAVGLIGTVLFHALCFEVLFVLLTCGVIIYLPALLLVALSFAVARTQELVADDGAALLTLEPTAFAEALAKVHTLQINMRKLTFAEALFSFANSHVSLDWSDPFAEWLLNSSRKIQVITRRLLRSHPDVDLRIRRMRSLC